MFNFVSGGISLILRLLSADYAETRILCPLKNQIEMQANVTAKNLGVLLFS